MTRFLSLFAAYRDAVTARLCAEGECRIWHNRADKAEERARDLERELIDTHKILNDRLAQRFLNTRLWTEATVADAPEHPGVSLSRPQGRQQVAAMNHQFKTDLDKFFKQRNDANSQ